MNVHVSFGTDRSKVVSVPEGSTVAKVFAKANQGPLPLTSYKAFINDERADFDVVVTAGQTVKFQIPLKSRL